MKLDVLNIQGQKTGRTIDLPDDIFGIEPNRHVLWLSVRQYLANQRQGTHKSKERGELAGSTRKLHRQKGTGSSRKGDIKNPLFRGGGRIFGPSPRNYGFALNKKVRKLARKSALSVKAHNGSILVVEDFTFDVPRTKELKSILDKLEVATKRTLLVTGEMEHTVLNSSKNLAKASVMRAQDLNPYVVLNSEMLVLSEGSIEKIKATFA